MGFFESLWRDSRKAEFESALKGLKELRPYLEKNYPDALESTYNPYMVRVEDLVKRCEDWLEKWDGLSKKEIQLQAKQFLKEIKDLQKELASLDKQLAQKESQLAQKESQLAQKESQLARKELQAKKLGVDYNRWQKRLETLRKKSLVPILAGGGGELSPKLQKKRDRLLKEQEELIRRAKMFGVKAVFDEDGWLTG